jgi:hypothetical protein
MDAELESFLSQRFEETRRHFDVVAEGLRGEIRAVAEGHLGLGSQLQEFRDENELAHREILAAVKFSYAELDRRITRLESLTANLEARLNRMESSR